VVNLGAFYLQQRALAEGSGHRAFFGRADGFGDAMAEDPHPGGDPVSQVVAGDQPMTLGALEGFDIRRRIDARHTQDFIDERRFALRPGAADGRLEA
jgi:hypothetical protein